MQLAEHESCFAAAGIRLAGTHRTSQVKEQRTPEVSQERQACAKAAEKLEVEFDQQVKYLKG